MKKVIFSLMILFFVKIGFSQNSLEVYNNTDKEIKACFVSFDHTNKNWTSEGWIYIDAYSSKTINCNKYTGDMYIHGYSINPGTFWTAETKNKWGSGFSFCIDPNKTFKIRFADKISCDNRASFSKTTIKNGKNSWTFNP